MWWLRWCGKETSTQVSDDFAKQARAMAETRLDARKAFLKTFSKQIQTIWVFAGKLVRMFCIFLYSFTTSAEIGNDPLATALASLESLFVPVSREHHCTGMHLTTMPFLVDVFYDVFYMLCISNMIQYFLVFRIVEPGYDIVSGPNKKNPGKRSVFSPVSKKP